VSGNQYLAYPIIETERKSMVSTYSGRTFSDFSYQAKVYRGSPAGLSKGIIFRSSADFDRSPTPSTGSGYAIVIDNEEYYIYKLVNGEFITLQGWTASGHILSDSYPQILKVTATGSTLVFYANGGYLTSITDSSLSSGRIGLIGYTGPDGGDHSYFYFDDILVTQ